MASFNAPGGCATVDAVAGAIRALVGAGLLRCKGGFVVLRHAALYFARVRDRLTARAQRRELLLPSATPGPPVASRWAFCPAAAVIRA